MCFEKYKLLQNGRMAEWQNKLFFEVESTTQMAKLLDVRFLRLIFLVCSLLFFFIFSYLFFWLRWVFIAACGLSLVAARRDHSSLRMGFSLPWFLLLRSTGSRRVGFSSCGSRALEHRLSSCGTWAQLLCGMWDLPGPGLEAVSLALAARFLTTVSPGKPLFFSLHVLFHRITEEGFQINLYFFFCTVLEINILKFLFHL